MKLRRPYIERAFVLFFGVLLLAGAAAVADLLVTQSGWPTKIGQWFGWLFGVVVVLFGLWLGGSLLWHAVRPFRIDVDQLGWSVRTPKLNRYLRWDEIAAVVLADAPAAGRRPAAPRLLLVPAAGVDLGFPLAAESPVDSRAAVELFQLDDVEYGEARFARDLAVLAGPRLHNLCKRLAQPAGAIPLRRFPGKHDRALLMRWLDRRNALLFAAWYLLVLVPALLLTDLAEQGNELFGAVVLVVGVVAVVPVTFKIGFTFSGCRDLVEGAVMIDGPNLVTHVYSQVDRTSLHAGRATVLRPGSVRGYRKAWLLTHPGYKMRPIPDLLLSDPRTGRLRSRDDLRALATALRASPNDRDQTAGRKLDELAAQAPVSESPSDSPASDDLLAADDRPGVWRALAGIGRAVVLLGVVATVVFATNWVPEESVFVGPALMIIAAALFGLWCFYALYRILTLLDVLLRIVARAFR